MSVLAVITAAGVLGYPLLRPFGARTSLEGLVLRLLAGMTLLAVICLVVGSISLWMAELICYAVAVAGMTLLLRRRKGPPRQEPAAGGAPLILFERISVVAVAGVALLAVVSALAPPTNWDSVVAHLALPADYARMGRIAVLEGNAYSAYPHFMHALYATVYLHGGAIGCGLLSWFMALLAAGAAYVLAGRIAGRTAGIAAAAVTATMPVFFDQAGAVTIDLAFSALVLAALGALMAWRDDGRLGWVVLGAWLAGSACGIRHTGYLVCVLLALGVFFAPSPSRTRVLLIFAGLAVAGALPWLARSALVAGNPVYPFFMNVFPSGGIPDTDITAIAAHSSVGAVTLKEFALFPWNVVMHPERYDGWAKSPGPFVLLLAVPAMFVGGRRARAIGLYAFAGIAAMFFFRQYARYLLPFFAPLAALAGVGLVRLGAMRKPAAALLVCSYAFFLVLDAGAMYFKVPVVLGLESRRDYLVRRVERYPAFEWVNENVAADRTTLTVDPRNYYLTGRSNHNMEALRPLAGRRMRDQVQWLDARHIDYFMFPQAYAEESPGYRESGLLEMFNAWRNEPRHFRLLKRLELPRPRQAGTEIVEIYEVHP